MTTAFRIKSRHMLEGVQGLAWADVGADNSQDGPLLMTAGWEEQCHATFRRLAHSIAATQRRYAAKASDSTQDKCHAAATILEAVTDADSPITDADLTETVGSYCGARTYRDHQPHWSGAGPSWMLEMEMLVALKRFVGLMRKAQQAADDSPTRTVMQAGGMRENERGQCVNDYRAVREDGTWDSRTTKRESGASLAH